jgi:hypothetical protein
MTVNGAYLNTLVDNGNPITHIGLTDTGVELSGGTPAYARKAVTWSASGAGADADGTIRPTADLDFDIPAGADVDGWQGYSAATGGIAYGITALTLETFAAQGVYTLEAALTAVNHAAA